MGNSAKKSSDREIVYFAGDIGNKPWDIRSSIYAKGVFYRNVFTQGVYLNEDSELVPGLFSSWTSDPAAKSYTVQFDGEYKFGAKNPVKPQDVEFLYLKVFLTPEDYPPFPFQLNLKGVEKIKKGTPFQSGMCDCIKIKDSQITFYLKKFDPYFLHNLAHYFYPIAPQDSFGPDLFSFKGIPVGSGPYKVSSYDKEKVMAMLELKDSFKNREDFKKSPLRVRFYNSGDIKKIDPDITYDSSIFEEGSRRRRVVGLVPDAIRLISFNFENELGKNSNFREVISLAIDREEIVGDANDRESIYGLILNKKIKIDEPRRRFDKRASKEIVSRHFKDVSDERRKLKALYFGSSQSKKPKIFKLVEKQLSDVGVYVEFSPSDFVDVKRGTHSDVVMTSVGKILPFHDVLYPFFLYSGSNDGLVNNDFLDNKMKSLYEVALGATSADEKKTIVGQLARLHAENFVQVPIFKTFPVVYVKNRIRSLRIGDPLGLVDFSKIEQEEFR